jgi:hypothetical protein
MCLRLLCCQHLLFMKHTLPTKGIQAGNQTKTTTKRASGCGQYQFQACSFAGCAAVWETDLKLEDASLVLPTLLVRPKHAQQRAAVAVPQARQLLVGPGAQGLYVSLNSLGSKGQQSNSGNSPGSE